MINYFHRHSLGRASIMRAVYMHYIITEIRNNCESAILSRINSEIESVLPSSST